MSKPDDKDPPEPKQPRREKISYDSRGNPVWQWAVDSGRHLMESTSLLLKRLDIPGLKLEDDESAGKQGVRSDIPAKYPALKEAQDTIPTATSAWRRRRAARPAAKKPVAAPRPRRSWWQRLFRRG